MRAFAKVSYAKEDVVLPVRKTSGSAGYDFVSPVDQTVAAGDSYVVDTQIKAYMNPGEVLMLFPRSSYGFKYHMSIANTVGIIDADYADNPDNEGDIKIKVYNGGNKPLELKKGEAFCQGIFLPFLITDDDAATESRVGGIGSTTGK